MKYDYDTDLVKGKYVSRHEAEGASVPKNVTPEYLRSKKREKTPTGMSAYHLSLPPDCVLALQERYPNLSVGIAARKFIMEKLAEEQEIK